ncbi:MAG: DNA gyrase inhibitor YacG [Pseudomonadota bacterium]
MSNPSRPNPACPLCGEPRVHDFRPFCSQRCADLDLGKWMTGAYAVPAEEEDTPDTETVESQRARKALDDDIDSGLVEDAARPVPPRWDSGDA